MYHKIKVIVTWGRSERVIIMDRTQRIAGRSPEAVGVHITWPSVHFLGVYEYIYMQKGGGLGGG